MSADCTGVSAVAASNEHVKAPAKARVFMASLPSSPVRHWPGIYSLLLASCISVDAIPSAGSVVPCAIGGQYPIAAWLADDRDPNACDAGCPEQAIMCLSASFGRDPVVGTCPRHDQFVQEVSSFSSIEKISPASTLTLRTRQERPLVSLSLASYIPGATPVTRRRSSGSTVPSLSFLH